MIDPPRSTYLEDEHIHLWDKLDVQLTIERFREERGELKADVQPSSISSAGILPAEKVNLSSARSIKTYANTLDKHGLLDADTWFAMLTAGCELSKRRYREGTPSVRLAEVDFLERPRFVIYPYIEARGTTIWFGDGGVSKSMHALAACVSVATGVEMIPGGAPRLRGPVIYLDWEADQETTAERLAAICAGAEIDVPKDVIYMDRSSSLSESVREIRRAIALEGVVFAVVDSIGGAGGGDPEKAESVIRTMNAIRALEVPTLAIHHVTKEQKDKSKPFGSVYAPNLARLTWRLDKEQEEGAELVRVRLTNFKGNNVRLLTSQGHGLRFVNTDGEESYLEEVAFTQVSGLDLPATTKRGSIKYEVARVLRETAGLSLDEISVAVGLKRDTVYRTLKRTPGWFIEVDGVWSLVRTDGQQSFVRERPSESLPTLPDNLTDEDGQRAGQIQKRHGQTIVKGLNQIQASRTDVPAPFKGAESEARPPWGEEEEQHRLDSLASG